MRFIGTILLILFIQSCDSAKSKNTDNSLGQIDSPDKVVQDFYHWYLDNYYNPDYRIITPEEKIKDGQLYLDTTTYMSTIRSSGFFSQKYIMGQINLFKSCDEEIRKIKLKDYEECGCSPADMVKNCDFMLYYNWLYHQGEDTQDIIIKEKKEQTDNATVNIELLSRKGDTRGYQKLRVTLDKENGEWRISDIANAP